MRADQAALSAMLAAADSQKVAIVVGAVIVTAAGVALGVALLVAVFQAVGDWFGSVADEPGLYLGGPAIVGGIGFLITAMVQPSLLLALIIGGAVGLVAMIVFAAF